MYSVIINGVEYKLLSLYDIAEKILLNEYSEDDFYNKFDDFIDEIYETITIFNISYNVSFVLQKIDKIAYDCIFNEYKDSYISDIAYDIEKLLEVAATQEIVYNVFNTDYVIKSYE